MRWASFGWVASQALAFVSTVVTARLLAPELFGLITLILVIVSAASIFADAGTRAALVQFEDPIEDVVSTALMVVPFVGAVATAAVASLSWLIADFYDEPRLQPLAVALSGLLFLQSLQIVPDALLQRRFDLRLRRGLVDPLAIFLYGVVVVILALLGADEWSLVVGQYASAVTITAGTWLLARPRFRDGRPSVRTWRRIGRYGRHLLFANVIEVIESQGPAVTLGRNVTPTAVGLYGAGSRLSALPITGITHVAGQVVFPALSRLQRDLDRFRLRFLESLRLISMLTIPVCVILISLGEPIVVTLFGERWRGGGQVLQILGIWALGVSLTEVAREVFKASGQPLLLARNAFISAGALLSTLAVLWIGGWVTILTVAGARALSSGVALVAAAVALRGPARTGIPALWRAIRPGIIGGVCQALVIIGIARLLLPDFDTWHSIGGLDLGPLVPLAIIAGLAVLGAAVYATVVELAERGSMRALLSNIRLILRPAAGSG